MTNKNPNNTILRVDASMRKTGSYSRTLSDKLIEKLINTKGRVPKNKIIIRDLADGVPVIDENWIKANFTPLDERTESQTLSLARSDALVEELKSADQIVIGLPIYNFNVPAAFKAWIDQVVRSKLTFKYTDTGPQGLLNNKQVYILITSGGTQLDSELDFISDYLRHIFAFIGIREVTIIDSSGLGKDEAQTLARAHQSIESVNA
jgi:FMN-dependent NADH-azoreductase